MKRRTAILVQAAVVALMAGVVMLALGAGGVEQPEQPRPATTARKATEAERHQWEVDQLSDVLDHMRGQWERELVEQAPTGYGAVEH